jgi:hypothetical protein
MNGTSSWEAPFFTAKLISRDDVEVPLWAFQEALIDADNIAKAQQVCRGLQQAPYEISGLPYVTNLEVSQELDNVVAQLQVTLTMPSREMMQLYDSELLEIG